MSDLSLQKARELLLPGLCATAGRHGVNGSWDLTASYDDNCLYLISPNHKSVVVTRAELDDDSFKCTFGRRLDAAMTKAKG
jgi:hypothetical protein